MDLTKEMLGRIKVAGTCDPDTMRQIITLALEALALRTPVEGEGVEKARDIVDAWCVRYVDGMPPSTARDKLIADILAIRAADEDETYEIGKRDGREQAVQEIDCLTGGDGEYRYCTDGDPERHTPDAATMKQRIVDRFAALAPSPQPVAEAVTWPPGPECPSCRGTGQPGGVKGGAELGLCHQCEGRGYIQPISVAATSPQPEGLGVEVTDEMVERAARAMEPMAFREEFTATDEWFELEQEGRNQAFGRARIALTAALQPKE